MEDNLQGVNDCLNGFFETLCQGLTVACDRGNTAIVSRLVQLPGLDLNYQDVFGYTPAITSSICGHTECVRILAETDRADWNKRENNQGWTPLYAALCLRYPDIVDIIVQQPNIDYTVKDVEGETLGHAAVWGGSVECVEKLVAQEKFDSWNVPDGPEGDTPIMWALKLCKTEIVEILIRCPQVDLSCRDKEGWSLVFRAIQRNELGKKMLKIFENHSLSL